MSYSKWEQMVTKLRYINTKSFDNRSQSPLVLEKLMEERQPLLKFLILFPQVVTLLYELGQGCCPAEVDRGWARRLWLQRDDHKLACLCRYHRTCLGQSKYSWPLRYRRLTIASRQLFRALPLAVLRFGWEDTSFDTNLATKLIHRWRGLSDNFRSCQCRRERCWNWNRSSKGWCPSQIEAFWSSCPVGSTSWHTD